MPKLEFVNHSCAILSHNNISLAMDPWIEGSVFNNSWNLLVKTPSKSIKKLSKSQYIWFSHEHPDHFNPSNLKIFSKDNTFLFQKTIDGRVIKFLKKISPNVKEIKFNEKINLTKNFNIEIIPFQYLDSMLISKIDNFTVLNLNDCDIKNLFQLKFIKKKTGHIDILLVQFSYALGRSNKDNMHERKKWAKEILKKLSHIIEYLDPKIVIPFASFCYFSRSDNFYMNDSINKIEETIHLLSKKNSKVKFLALYPGDSWDFNSKYSNSLAFKKYNNDYKNIKVLPLIPQNIHFDTLKKSSEKFIHNTKKMNNLFNLYYLFNYNKYKIQFKLTDLNQILFFDFNNSLIRIDELDFELPWCSLTSQSLNNLFVSGYGYDALIIGGRFEANQKGFKALNSIFKFQAKNYQNIYYNFNSIFYNFFNNFIRNRKIFHKR